MHIKKGDTIVVISGDSRGKKGKVLRISPENNRLIVEGVNFVKRHTKASQQNPQGGIIEKEAPIHISNVMLFVDGVRTRSAKRFLDTGRKVRVSRKTGEDIDS
ncbi:MAG: 50S ribosomal protein L24 [Candidatus Neomarinimicrobiota bacterium]